MRAAIYARYSTNLQNETSITAQVNACSDYCKAHQIDIASIFIDEAQTGTNMQRDGFIRLLAGAKAKDFDAVIIYDITRGSRDVGDWFEFRKQMALLGIKIISATEKLGNIMDPNDFMVELITVGMGQHHVLQTRQKSRAGIKVRASEGKFCGGFPPLGYIIEDGNYKIEPQEAAGVRMIFESYADGKGYGYIVDKLYAMGIKSKRGARIGENAIHYLLKNERFIGRFTWNKRQVKVMSKWAGGKPNPDAITIDGIIPRIISDELWGRVQNRMNANTHNKLNKSRLHREYLLSGLLRCAKCGGAYVGVTTTNKKGYEYKFYTCATKRRLHTCNAKNIAAADIEPLIVNLLKNDILNGDMIEKTADAILTAANGLKDTRSDFKDEISDVDRKISNLTKTLADGFDSESVREALGELETKRKILKEQLAAASPTFRLPSREELLESLRKDAAKIINDSCCMKEMLQKYIVKIEISDEEITVYAVKDLASTAYAGTSVKVLQNAKSAGHEFDALNTVGCGGRI